MDSLTFISRLIESLAWPVVILILGIIFRDKLHDLLSAVRKLKAGPVEAEFEIAAKLALDEATHVRGSESNNRSFEIGISQRGSQHDIVFKLLSARKDPTSAVLEGWNHVEE